MKRAGRIPLGRTALVVQALAALGFLGFLLQSQGYLAPRTYEYEIAFSSALALKDDAEHPVTVRGLDVGKVEAVRYEDGRAIASIALRDSTASELLRADARAILSYRSAFANLAIDLDPGGAREPLREGARIPASQSAGPVAPDEVLRTLDADTRAYLAILLGELRIGVEDRTTPLRAALSELGRASDPSARVAEALADRRRLLTRLVGQLEIVFNALGDRRDRLAEAIRGGEATLSVTGRREQELADSLRRLPRTLAALDGALRETEALGRPLEPALARLRPVARRLPLSLRAVRDVVPEARALLDDLAPIVPEAQGPVARLRRAAEELGPATRSATPSVRDLPRLLEPIAREREGFRPLGENFSGAFSVNDRNGPMLRTIQLFEPFDPAAFGAPGARGRRLAGLREQVTGALLELCRRGDAQACLVPALTPGLGAEPAGATALPRLVPLERARGSARDADGGTR